MFELLGLVGCLPLYSATGQHYSVTDQHSSRLKRKQTSNPDKDTIEGTNKVAKNRFSIEEQQTQKLNDRTIVAFFPDGQTCPLRQYERIRTILNLGDKSSTDFVNVVSVDHAIDYIDACSQNSMVHLGEFADGRQQCYGKERLLDGSIYIGYYEDGQRKGLGKIIYKDGSKFEGSFVAGKRHGLGTFTHVDGTIFTAIYTNDRRNGLGQYTFPTGSSYTCEYRENELQSIKLPDGSMISTANYSKNKQGQFTRIKQTLDKAKL